MRIKLPQGFKKYVTNTAFLFLNKLVEGIVILTIWAFVIRYLGPQQFGLLSYALSFVLLFMTLTNLGLDNIVVKKLVLDKKNKEQILGTTFFLKFFGGVAAIIAIFISVNILQWDPHIRQLILILSLRFIFLSFNCIDFYFQSIVISKYTVYSKILALICTSILCLLFVCLNLPVIYFVFVFVIESGILAMGLVYFYTAKYSKISVWKFKWNIAKELIRNSWPLIVSGIAISVYMRIDQIMIKAMLNDVSVGYYSAAVRISEVFYFIPLLVTSSLFPAIIKIKSIDSILYQNRLVVLFSILLWIAVGIAICVTIMSGFLIKMFYGQGYLPAVGVLSLHIWMITFVFFSVVRSKWAINENLQFYIMIYAVIGAGVNILLNLSLIPIWGIKGAASSAVITRFITEIVSNLFSKKTRPIFMLQLKSIWFFRGVRLYFKSIN